MEHYLLVRDSDGAILDEVDAEFVARMVEHLATDAAWLRGLSLVRTADHPGAIFGTTSIVGIRSAEFAPPPRMGRNTEPQPGR